MKSLLVAQVKLAWGLIKNSDCNWVVSFTGFEGYGSNLLPGFLALKHGLLFAWDRGL
jgi:hypothetical protein